MPTSRRTLLALLLGLALGLLLALSGLAFVRTGALQALTSGPPPAAPTFPARVVEGPMLRGQSDTVLTSLSFTYHALIDAHLRRARPDMDVSHVLRHRSLQLPDFGVGLERDEPGLIVALLTDAEAKGWEVDPALPVDAGVAYQAVGLRQGRWLFLVVGFGDTMAPDDREDVADDAYACCPDGQCPAPPAPGLAPCTVEGFVPVYIWTNLPRDAWIPSMIDPAMRSLQADDRAWSDPPTWEQHVARSAGG